MKKVNDQLLDIIIEKYDHYCANQPEKISGLMIDYMKQLEKTNVGSDFIRKWMEHILEIDPGNEQARSYVSKYKLTEKVNLLHDLTFPPVRESDSPLHKERTLKRYKEICEHFLHHVDEKFDHLQNELNFYRKMDNENFIELFTELTAFLEQISKEIVHLKSILEDLHESSKRTFIHASTLEQIQKSIGKVNHLKEQWDQKIQSEKEEEEEKTALDELNEMIGLTNVKKRIHQFYQYLKYQKSRRQQGFKSVDEPSLNMILLGNPGTGKTTIARLLAKIYYELGVLPTKEVIETNRSQLVGAYVGQTEENVRMMVEKALGGVLFIDEAYSLKRPGQSENDYGQNAVDTLVSLMTSEEYGGKFSVIMAGYPEEMRQFLDANPGLRSRFPESNIIELDDYSTDELLQIGEKIAHANDYVLTAAAKRELKYLIEQSRVDHTFGNARTVHHLIMQAIFKKGHKESNLPVLFQYSVLDRDDFEVKRPSDKPEKPPMEKLNELIGLKEVKDAVRTYISFVKMQKYRREQDLPTVPIQLHSVFTGNPGTGKTTVAKIYAELLKECGILKRGHLVVCGRADLVAGYVGQSAIKTKKKIKEALGGVLFIDEAYSLFRENNQDYGKEVIDTLVEEMTKHKENLVVILAGYPDEMKQLLESNPGLKSRFKKFFHFADYHIDELIEIMHLFAKKYAYKIDPDAAKYLKQQMTVQYPGGNGRFAENLIHEAIQQQSLRLSKKSAIEPGELSRLTKEDFVKSYQLLQKGE